MPKRRDNIDKIYDIIKGIDARTGASRKVDRVRQTRKFRDTADEVEFYRDLADGIEGSERMLKRSEEKMKKKYGPSTQRRTKGSD